MRVLVTGAGGQLGHDLVTACGDHEVVACDRAALDLASRPSVLQAITGAAPDVVVHAGAWTAVDACEDDPDRAFLVNATGTRHVGEAARGVGARVVYVSTDYVFDGEKDGPYVESDEPNPKSVYGQSKLAGERELDDSSTIVRTSWVCGLHGANMVKTILRLAGEHERLTFVDDQRGCPTFTEDLAGKIVELVEGGPRGTFHVTNQGAVSWFEFAQAVLDAAGLDPGRVDPVSTAQFPRPAPRPKNSVLDNAALRSAGIALLPDFHEPLARLVAALR